MDFGAWTGLSESTDQKKRFASALRAECTPLSIDFENKTGEFSGSHGYYKTSCESCSCGDFIRRHLPCKHMYRLAVELGLIEGSPVADSSKIRRADEPRLSLDSAVATAEKLSLEGQAILREILLDVSYRGKPYHVKHKKWDYSEVLSSGLLEETSDGIVTIALLAKERKNLCIYLGRRNENDDYFDGDNWVSVPKGATTSVTINVGPDGSITQSSCLSFPNDKITALLNKYGVNRCLPNGDKK